MRRGELEMALQLTKKPHFPMLEAEISKNGIKKKELARNLGIEPRTLSLKLNGKTEFSLSEALYVHSIFPAVTIEELFCCDDSR